MKKRHFIGMFIVVCCFVTNCDQEEQIADLTKDVEIPDLTPNISGQAIYSEEQLTQIADFQTAFAKFKTMTLSEFKDNYGPQTTYQETLAVNPTLAKNLDLITKEYPLQGNTLDTFESKGFVILQDHKYDTFLQGFIDIYKRDLPVYFSADAMLDALHLSFDRMLADLETWVLSKDLEALLNKMKGAISIAAQNAQSEAAKQSLDDAAVWICTAESLLKNEKLTCPRGQSPTVNAYLQHIEEEQSEETSVFGELRTEDFSQFKPRGHYTDSELLKRYFKAMMWTQRTGLNFSKYSRHARLAYLLSDLVRLGNAEGEYMRIDNVITALVGVSDSMNIFALREVASTVGISSLQSLDDTELLNAFVDTAIKSGAAAQKINSTIMSADTTLENGKFTPIPPAFHFMGQRFVVDSYVFTNVVYDRVKNPDRHMPSPLDTWFVLGNRETVPLLSEELDTYNYHANLAALDYLISGYDEDFWSSNFYNGWLSALMTLNQDVTENKYPEVMRTQAWQHRMLQTQLGSWAHLRHDTLLYAKPSYGMVSCEYPDAWVEAYPDFFEQIADMAETVDAALNALGIDNINEEADGFYFYGNSLKHYFSRLAEVALMLKDIADAEVEGVRLNEVQLDFMNQLIFESTECGAPPYSGWYSDIIYKYSEDNMEIFEPVIADIHTASQLKQILHVGAGNPNLMVLAVSTDCQNRAYVGPVLSYHEIVTENFTRLNDEEWKEMLKNGQESRPQWTKSFVR